MRIFFLTQYYPPEIGASQNRVSYLVRRLAKSGHTLTVLTAMPNCPEGRIFDGYRGQFLQERDEMGVKVLRAWVYASPQKGFLRRMANYLSFMCTSIVVGLTKLPSQDVLVLESPPLFLGISGWILSWWLGAKFVFNVADLWPESAVALGVLRNQLAIRCSTLLEEFLYTRADLLTGQTEGVVNGMRGRCHNRPVALMTNGVDPQRFPPSLRLPEAQKQVREEYGFGESFVVGFVGLHGLAQGLDAIIAAARLLCGHEDILFTFFGDGPEKPRLCQMAHQEGLRNIRFFSPQPVDRMAQILSAMNVSVVSLKRHPLFHGMLPSRLFESMGAGVPVVAAADGETRSLLERAQAGICVDPEDSRGIAQAILTLYGDRSLRASLSENGRTYVLRHYNREKVAESYEKFLLTCFPWNHSANS